ncbi:cytochrome P450 [Xylariaceae sp. FL0016]|nr:cytochrome P450 [Xylariaceae sp. FL0016]
MSAVAGKLESLGWWERWGIYAIAAILCACAWHTLSASRYPANLPRAGEPLGRQRFSLRTIWRYYRDCRSLYHEVYEKYSKRRRTVLVPGFGARNEIIMPQSAMRWVFSQPEEKLSHVEAFLDLNQSHYSLGTTKFVADGWQGELVRTQLNAVLENVCSAMNDELGAAFDQCFGTDTDGWKEVDLLANIRMVVGQAASRFTVGLPLCRDKQYLKDSFQMVDRLVLNAGLTGACPLVLRPIVGRLVCSGMTTIVERIKKALAPTYRDRLEIIQAAEDQAVPEPSDHLQMMLRFAKSQRPQELHDLDAITRRIIVANFASMHQTAMQVTNLLINILDSDKEFNTIAILRDEATRIVGSRTDGTQPAWTKTKVSQLIRADSAARETLRLHSFGNRSVFRKVMVDDLVTEDGIKLPKGAMLSFLGYPPQTEHEMYDDPLKYDPFRFSRAREAAADAGGRPGLSNLSFVSTSPQHLPFSHGKHACPGRFLIDFEMKMVLAYVLMNYDIEFPNEYQGKRPPQRWMAEATVPPPGVKLRVRRRKGTFN